MEVLIHDLRYGIRMLMKKPVFSLIAVATLALGIGANTAIFSVVNAVLLRALPYHNSNQLIVLSTSNASGDRDGFSILEVEDFRTRMQSLEDLSAFQSQSVNVTGGDRPDRLRGAFVTANFFKVFNLNPIVGRTLAEGEDKQGAEKLVVVSERVWRERLNADPTLSGQKMILNGEPFSVIGVITDKFKQPVDAEVQMWMAVSHFPGSPFQRDARFLMAMGHLKTGVSLDQAQAEATTVATQLGQVYPKENAGRGARIQKLHEELVGSVRPMLWLLFAAVGVILLIACANLANLLLARGLARQKEVAVRAALGAGRWRLIRQLLTETTLLGLLGGMGGVLLAHWGLYALLKLPQNFIDPRDAGLDTRVLLFALGISLLTGWLFGLVPALQLARPKLQSFLREGARGSGEGSRWNRVRGAFVIGQVALSLLLLVSTGLLLKSFDKLLRVDVGFKTEQLLTLEYRLPRNKYGEGETQLNFHRQVVDRLKEVPGVESATLVRALPFSGNGIPVGINILDREIPPPGSEPQVIFNTAMPNYFETMGMPLLKGRTFGNQDKADAPVVLVVNETMAKRFWPNQDPLGKQIKFVRGEETATVIGVVGDAKQFWLEEETLPQAYNAYSQSPGLFATAVVRTSVDPESLIETVRQAIWRVDPDQPMWKIRTVDFLIQRNTADRKFLMSLMGVFAVIALLLTSIGLYGVISYLVNQRTQEIGIRMALGAQTAHILRMILKQGMVMVLIGVALGLGAAWLLTGLMSKLLYQVSATDPITYAGIAALLVAVALFACFIPARRATKVEPLEALRYE